MLRIEDSGTFPHSNPFLHLHDFDFDNYIAQMELQAPTQKHHYGCWCLALSCCIESWASHFSHTEKQASKIFIPHFCINYISLSATH